MAKYSHEENQQDAVKLYEMIYALKTLCVPTIARVNGSAFGGGAGLICACDFALSVRSALFGFTEVRLGLLPAVISPFVIERIGKSACSRYFLTGERFGTEQAERIQMVQESFDDVNALDARLDEIISKNVLQSSPRAIEASKKLIEFVDESNPYSKQSKEYVTNAIASIRVSDEGQHGLNAFLEKKKPKWI
eukprot:CAMPEP_0201558818 /NCGR_PEP_ID=MMETSP0173_2-20130828/70197_1 /ASSEMBLY_ACC=CAM_ASM_000268 /TAXON_ID=218659 /ORGANISM="Vexillifera sp., Strain DIVA3 564/2" /LENGTH=191 /DNA_ID=CAMNT_0047972433 /DNA_START=201 /DNA_END=776 /DNA_ORIENTATION=+